MAAEAKSMETRVAVLEAHYEHLATKADLERLSKELGDKITAQTRWFAGVLIVCAGAFITAFAGLTAAILSRLP